MKSFGCHCSERRKPAGEINWRVIQRKCNHSAFNGYRRTPSKYSSVICLACHKIGRTKAKYIDEIMDLQIAMFG